MSRSLISNPRKLRKLSALVGRPIVKGHARGGTDHRIDAFAEDGTVFEIYKDGSIIERSATRRTPCTAE